MAKENGVGEKQDWRTRRWEETHQRIFETALRLFQELGFEDVSVSLIARGAGVSVPTFYAHYPSKEHLIMQLPTDEDMHALLATQPAELSLPDRIRAAVHLIFAQWSPEFREIQLARWKVIATTQSLRTRAAEFERRTAGMFADALPAHIGADVRPADHVVINAYLSALTLGMLAWADGDGERKLEEFIDEAFDALQKH